jgi:hypothetical protein
MFEFLKKIAFLVERVFMPCPPKFYASKFHGCGKFFPKVLGK